MVGELWYGGTIYTMRAEHETVEAIYVEKGIIVDVGTKERLCAVNNVDTFYHIRGNTMFPGFVDSHIHLIGHGERILRLDLTECTSYGEMLSLVQKRVNETPDGDWIIGEGWNENEFYDTKTVHVHDLDAISGKHPILLKRVCRHAMLVNSVVLKKAGITRETKDPKGGRIVKDVHGLTGVLHDHAQQYVYDILPKPSKQYVRKVLGLAIKDCYEKGLVGCHTEDLHYYDGFANTYEAYQHCIRQTPFKVNLLVHYAEMEHLPLYHDDHYIEFGAIKIFADGSLGGRTALLSEPYSDMLTTQGIAVVERAELANLVQKARQMRRPVAVHAIGDLAFENVLDVIEAYPPQPGQRDRIIHCQVLRNDLIKRAKYLSVVLDIQPIFVRSDFPSVKKKLGLRRLRYSYAWKTLLKEGLACAGGSDAPISDISPIAGMYAAISHADSCGICHQPQERLSPFEAISLYTTGSAKAIHKEHKRGMIGVGYEADFTIVDRDMMRISLHEIENTKVMMTVIDGRIVFRN